VSYRNTSSVCTVHHQLPAADPPSLCRVEGGRERVKVRGEGVKVRGERGRGGGKKGTHA